MLAVGHRLRRRRDFAVAIRGGRRAARGVLVIHMGLDRTNGTARAGFVIPRAVGGAVVRNRVRRRLRHLLRDRMAALAPGADFVVRVLPAAAGRSYQELGSDLDAALTAVGRPRRARETASRGNRS
jgi:ribonuclease P protein component